jgi:hypothetical protein
MSVLQELIKAGEMKIAREEMRIKRLQAQDAERAQRRKEIVRQMYPQIAEYIDFSKMVDNRVFLYMPVSIPGCVSFYLTVFIEHGTLKKTASNGKWAAFSCPDELECDMFTNDLEIALALAHKAWLAEHSTEPVYTDAEESA